MRDFAMPYPGCTAALPALWPIGSRRCKRFATIRAVTKNQGYPIAEQREGMKRICYELSMCGYACGEAMRLAPQLPYTTDLTMHYGYNMAVECCLLHARTLAEFFVEGSKSGDMQRRDFEPVDARRWSAEKADAKWLSEYRTQLNHHLAHLTFERARKTGWNLPGMTARLFKIATAWRDHLRDIGSDEEVVRALTDLVGS